MSDVNKENCQGCLELKKYKKIMKLMKKRCQELEEENASLRHDVAVLAQESNFSSTEDEEGGNDSYMEMKYAVHDRREKEVVISENEIYVGEGKKIVKSVLQEVEQYEHLQTRVRVMCQEVFGSENLHKLSSSGKSEDTEKFPDVVKMAFLKLLTSMTPCSDSDQACTATVKAAIRRVTENARRQHKQEPLNE